MIESNEKKQSLKELLDNYAPDFWSSEFLNEKNF
jgi:hypothetical protein